MVRTTLILSLAMLAAVPVSAAVLMDSAPAPAGPEDQRVPPPVSVGGPRGHVVIQDLENTLRDGMTYGQLKNSITTLPPAPAAGNVIAEPNAVAVPEPATWAMMLGGFAFAGITIRRRSTRRIRDRAL